MNQEHYSYVFQAYPKALDPPDGGKQIVVLDADAEAAKIAEWAVLEEPSAGRAELLARAAELEIKVDGRWSDKRLAEVIAAAE